MNTSPDHQMTDTNDGFLVGVDPATPPQGGMVAETVVGQSQQEGLFAPGEQQQQQQQQQQQVPQTVESLPPMADPRQEEADRNQQYFTADQVAQIRQQEKDKLYSRIVQTEEQLRELQEAESARQAEIEAERQRIEDERRKEEEAAMEVRDLLERREQEWNQRFEQLEEERARQEALVKRERELQELQLYRQQVMEQNAEYIMPELRDLISGSTHEEIDRSVNEMRDRTSAIMQNIADAAQSQRPSMRGVTPTGAPPVGPMEQASTYENLTADQISNMTLSEYQIHRDRLLKAASPNFRG
jgi:hypothetical protein